jgi:hypothetical protein
MSCLGKKQARRLHHQIVLADKAGLIAVKFELIRRFDLDRIAERDWRHKGFDFVKAILAAT